MKRIILDTNIYGELVIDIDVEKIINNIGVEDNVIYGMKIIRKELRDTPKDKIYGAKKMRIIVLSAYDQIIRDHELSTTNQTKNLAEEYFLTYQNLGGSKGRGEMENDLLIVAAAALNNLDIVISDDCPSICSDKALQSYKIINALKRLRTPNFVRYLEFKRWFS
ncbi:MAG: hypothetical protein KKC75_06685 [Nanoarchaeota archaeon]|nr:hypothetical protein [Nanoarchaeota archaeon]MBU1005238.1 hypothetical protein [Nanoarchaeota archaeon]